jgi:hypothetical protein
MIGLDLTRDDGLALKFHEFSSRERGEECATGQPSHGNAGLDPRRT